MKKNKGFTLIELLAVIVILAIIALIAVPVILNIIDKANKSAFKDTAYGIVSAAELYFAASQLDLESPNKDVIMNTDDNRLELKGDVPTGKVAVTRDGRIAIAVQNGRYCAIKYYNGSDVVIFENMRECNLPKRISEIGTTTSACVTNGKCTDAEIAAGIKVTINVNDEKHPYDFYVIADDGEKVTLIMDRNLGAIKAWVSGSDYTANASCTYTSCNDQGPITILNYLTSQIKTENWENIPAITSYEYKNNPDETGATKQYGYRKLNITNGAGVLTSTDGSTTNLTGTMRARLLTHEEANTLKTNNGNTTPTWLYGNLNSSSAPYGYWFLTAHPSISNAGRGMYSDGDIFSNLYVHYDTTFGIRPVIELSK